MGLVRLGLHQGLARGITYPIFPQQQELEENIDGGMGIYKSADLSATSIDKQVDITQVFDWNNWWHKFYPPGWTTYN